MYGESVCKYYDESSFLEKFSSSSYPVIMSGNIQSLQSKFNSFSDWLTILESKNLIIDVIALQECWEIKDPSSTALHSYHDFIFNTRTKARGGGVGFYVKKSLNYTLIHELSFFVERVFESICISVDLGENNNILLISLYRPPAHNSLTLTEQSEAFLDNLESLLSKIDNLKCKAFILKDSCCCYCCCCCY